MRLIAHLVAWRNASGSTDTAEAPPETANFLLTSHLAVLSVHTALSNHEHIYRDTVCVVSFRRNLRFATTIVQNRTPERPAVRRLSLGTSTIEAICYLAIKCRDNELRFQALYLLRCVGREGVWDGMAMVIVAAHVIRLEHGVCSDFPSEGDTHSGSFSRPCAAQSFQESSMSHELESLQHGTIDHELVSETIFEVNRDARTVKVDCGWFYVERRTWHQRSQVMTW